MVGLGFAMLGIFAVWVLAERRQAKLEQQALAAASCALAIPAPWIASELGWFVAEFGRQPWAIGEVLPTFLATRASRPAIWSSR